MGKAIQRNPEKPISEELDDVLGALTADQVRFVIIRQEFSTDAEAAKALELIPDTVYHWDNKELVNKAVVLMAQDGLTTAVHLRRRNLAKAMAVKVAGLDSDDERERQRAATEIIEWELGKATQPQTQDVEIHGNIGVGLSEEEQDRALESLAEALGDRILREGQGESEGDVMGAPE